MDKTARLSMPLIVPGQAQKELFHNEALQIVDILLAGGVEEGPRNTPPATAAVGETYIVGGSPTGDWAQHADCIAGFTPGGWRFIAPTPGLALRDKSTGTLAVCEASGWVTGVVRANSITVAGVQVLGARTAAIADPGGGTTVDAQARGAIEAILGTLRQHGLISV